MSEMWISHGLLVPLNVKVDRSKLTLLPNDVSVLKHEGEWVYVILCEFFNESIDVVIVFVS